MRWHLGQKDFKCHLCSSAFVSQGRLNTHLVCFHKLDLKRQKMEKKRMDELAKMFPDANLSDLTEEDIVAMQGT